MTETVNGIEKGGSSLTTAQVNTEVDTALNTAIPAAPTAISNNALMKGQLVYFAPVTSSADTTHFVSSVMIGYGTDFFTGWTAYVVWDAGGAGNAPQGEYRAITDYVTATGTFTLGAASTQLAATDIVLLVHPFLAGLGLIGDTEAAGAVTTTDTMMAYVKQLVTNSEAVKATIGLINTAAATGAVTDTDLAMAYIKQIVTDVIALNAANPAIMATGTFTTSSTTVPRDTGRTEAEDYWNGCIIIPLTGDAALQPRVIADYTTTNDVFTLETPFTAAPGTVAYVIVPANSGSKTFYKDIWCTAQTNNVAIHAAAGVIDLDFPNVVVAAAGSARGLPLGAIVTEAYLLMMFDLLDDSAAANYLDASKDIRVKLSTEAHWAEAPVAFTSVAGDWYTLASGMSSQVIIGAADVVATYGVQTAGSGAATYNIGSDQTENATALTALASHLQMKNLRTGLRIYYRMP